MTDFSRERLLRLLTVKGVEWRHDVDLSLTAAVRMARLEHLAGVRSTFYVMATGDWYNPFSREGWNALSTIRSFGHRLGLHVDANGLDPERAIGKTQALFDAGLTGLFELDRVSFHMPSPAVLWRDFPGVTSAYGSRWKGRYVADSRREFGPEKEALIRPGYQVNLHPEWWLA